MPGAPQFSNPIPDFGGFLSPIKVQGKGWWKWLVIAFLGILAFLIGLGFDPV